MSREKILCEGYLEKKEKKWEAFWVRLIETRLYFYQEKYVPIQQFHGFLELSGNTRCSTHKSKKSKYQFKIKTDKGVFLFQTIMEDERTSWMANILQARDSKIRSISSGNIFALSSPKHSDTTSWSPRRPSSATGIPSSRSTERTQMKRPCSAENPSKNRTNTSDKFSSSFTSRSRSASCNDVPSSHPPPIHMETHPTLRRKQENSPTERSKRSRFFSLPGFKQISRRLSRSQDNLGEVSLLRKEQHLSATHVKRGGSLNLEIVSPDTFQSDTIKSDRLKDFKHKKSRKNKFELNSFDNSAQGLPPRSASVCSGQSIASKGSESAHSTLSLDRKSKKRTSKEQKKNLILFPEKDTKIISKNPKTDQVNKLSGIRCQLNVARIETHSNEPTNQQVPSHNDKITDPYYKAPNHNKHINTHSNLVAKKPPTPTRHTTGYDNDSKTDKSDLSVSPVKPPIQSKRHNATNGTSERHRIEAKRFGHNLGKDERSALLSHRGTEKDKINHTQNSEEFGISRNRTDLQNRGDNRMNPFYENETALYCRFSWFHGDLTREDSENLLKFCGKVGSFLIRNSKKHSKHLCLSLRYSDRIRHFKIDRSVYGYSIDGLEGNYTNLNKLVEVFITWNDNMVKPLEKVVKQTTDLTPETPPLGSESLIYEDMSDDII